MTNGREVTYTNQRMIDGRSEMEKKDVKTILDGNAFYEIDLSCRREKERQREEIKKQQMKRKNDSRRR